MKRPSTLQLTFPCGQTLVLAFLIVVLLVGAVEAVARQPIVARHMLGAVDSENAILDAKIGVLDRLVARQGRIDCLFLGSSVVAVGLDPAAVEQAYRARTGDAITCYNFGVSAMAANGAGILADLLVERYHPRLLIYGFSLRDMTDRAPQADLVLDMIADTPWVRYKRGAWNVEGWLVDHLAVARYYLAFRNWPRADFRSANVLDQPPQGFLPVEAMDVTIPAAVRAPDYFQEYAISPGQRAGLARILAQQSPRTQVILVEVPLPAVTRDFCPGGRAGYAAYVEQVLAEAERAGIPAWATSDLNLLPADSWIDLHHLRGRGAQVFSTWLGDRLGQAVQAGTLALPR